MGGLLVRFLRVCAGVGLPIDGLPLTRAPKAAQLYGFWPGVSPSIAATGKIVLLLNQQLAKQRSK
jgi:hypothetical protein